MSVKEEPIEGSDDNFWDTDGYKKTVKWVDDGMLMCNEMIKLINERAEIENKYASKLKLWSQKWLDTIEKGPEYGIHKGVLQSSIEEAELLADVHILIRDQLTDVQNNVKKWKNENYTKQVVGVCKEAKNLEDEFKKAQKPWVKKLLKLQKAKKMVQVAESNERLISSQLENRFLNDDQTRKLSERHEKAKRETENGVEKMESAIKELNQYEPIYAADMECVYEKAEICEGKRLDFLKQLLVEMHACVDISMNKNIPHIYLQMRKTIENCDSKKDLRWWSLNYGVNMPRILPSNQIVNGTSSQYNSLKKQPANHSPQLSHVPQSSRQSHVPQSSNNLQSAATIAQPSNPRKVSPHRLESYDANLNPFGEDDAATASSHPSVSKVEKKLDNPFDEEDEAFNGIESTNLVPDDLSAVAASNAVVKGVSVEAIFDYVGQEDDELTFKIGDRFIKLEDRDDQGWCKGQIGNKIGLYPDNYVKVLQPKT